MDGTILSGEFVVTLDPSEERRVRGFDPRGFDWGTVIDGKNPYDYDDMGDGRWSVTFEVYPKPEDSPGGVLDEPELISLCAEFLNDAGVGYSMCSKRKVVEDLGDRKYRITVHPD
jgi:hypothetical protein